MAASASTETGGGAASFSVTCAGNGAAARAASGKAGGSEGWKEIQHWAYERKGGREEGQGGKSTQEIAGRGLLVACMFLRAPEAYRTTIGSVWRTNSSSRP